MNSSMRVAVIMPISILTARLKGIGRMTEVANSGNDVPSATSVSPHYRSGSGQVVSQGNGAVHDPASAERQPAKPDSHLHGNGGRLVSRCRFFEIAHTVLSLSMRQSVFHDKIAPIHNHRIWNRWPRQRTTAVEGPSKLNKVGKALASPTAFSV